jgi:hypothetical protein
MEEASDESFLLPAKTRALKGQQIERANKVEHRSTCEQNTGWKPMLHWPSGLSSDLPEPSR